jgi:ferric-dicitrate binding protein FerR (iron transport regulator)
MAQDEDETRDLQGLTEADRRRRRSRSIALAVALAALVILFYVVTIAKMGPGVLQRPL